MFNQTWCGYMLKRGQFHQKESSPLACSETSPSYILILYEWFATKPQRKHNIVLTLYVTVIQARLWNGTESNTLKKTLDPLKNVECLKIEN